MLLGELMLFVPLSVVILLVRRIFCLFQWESLFVKNFYCYFTEVDINSLRYGNAYSMIDEKN